MTNLGTCDSCFIFFFFCTTFLLIPAWPISSFPLYVLCTGTPTIVHYTYHLVLKTDEDNLRRDEPLGILTRTSRVYLTRQSAVFALKEVGSRSASVPTLRVFTSEQFLNISNGMNEANI